MAMPGGCDIGARPIDLHILGLRALGATLELRSVYPYVMVFPSVNYGLT